MHKISYMYEVSLGRESILHDGLDDSETLRALVERGLKLQMARDTIRIALPKVIVSVNPMNIQYEDKVRYLGMGLDVQAEGVRNFQASAALVFNIAGFPDRMVAQPRYYDIIDKVLKPLGKYSFSSRARSDSHLRVVRALE